MPILEDDTRTPPGQSRMYARPSLPMELDWALSAAHRLPQSLHPALEAVYRAGDLRDRVVELWRPDEQMGYAGYLEVSAVAYPAGLLFSTDSDEFLRRLDDMCAHAPSGYEFLAETPSDRLVLQHRLEVLRTDTARRRQYVEVITDAWTALRDGWQRDGLPAVEAEVRRRQEQIDKVTDWRSYVNELARLDESPALVEIFEAAGEIVVVPAWFARNKLWMDLPDTLLIGVATAEGEARNRAATDQLARRVKALSDPTRLAMLEKLAHHPMTVGELADRMALAQPTVSNHVKLLREAGLVRSKGEGRGQPLVVHQAELAAVLTQVAERTMTPLSAFEPNC